LVQKNKILQIENLSVLYGNITAVRNVTIAINEGEVTALLGSNGAGKSTLLKAILGIACKNTGKIMFLGQDITNKPTDAIVASGITYIPEGGGILPRMTVMENLLMGALYFNGVINMNLQRVFKLFPILEKRLNKMGATLSGGERSILAIGRALMSTPKLLMMDEPSLGLAPLIVTEVFHIIDEMRKEGYTVILSEQNSRKALQYADYAYIFKVGNIILQGKCEELSKDSRVQRLYLGGD
jgi:branched-chain amino acid transport system ATP-binding protein